MVRVEAVGYKHMPDAVLSQNNPVSGDKYVVLATLKNVRVISVDVVVTWTVQPTPAEVHITIDGNNITHAQGNPVSTSHYEIAISGDTDEVNQPMRPAFTYVHSRAFYYEGKAVKIEVETTGGTVSNISARVKYAVLRP